MGGLGRVGHSRHSGRGGRDGRSRAIQGSLEIWERTIDQSVVT